MLIIFRRLGLVYNKINMKKLTNLTLIVILCIFSITNAETITVSKSTSSPYPSYSDVSGIVTSPPLGVNDVGLGGNAGNATLAYDASALSQLSDMINQILAGINNTNAAASQNSHDTSNDITSSQDQNAQ